MTAELDRTFRSVVGRAGVGRCCLGDLTSRQAVPIRGDCDDGGAWAPATEPGHRSPSGHRRAPAGRPITLDRALERPVNASRMPGSIAAEPEQAHQGPTGHTRQNEV